MVMQMLESKSNLNRGSLELRDNFPLIFFRLSIANLHSLRYDTVKPVHTVTFHMERIPTHMSTTSNDLFPSVCIKDLTQTLNLIQTLQLSPPPPTFHFQTWPRKTYSTASGKMPCPRACHAIWGLVLSVEYLATSLVFGPQCHGAFPSHSSCPLLFLITHLSGPDCLVTVCRACV